MSSACGCNQKPGNVLSLGRLTLQQWENMYVCESVYVAVSLSTIWMCVSCTAAVTVLPSLGGFVPFAL